MDAEKAVSRRRFLGGLAGGAAVAAAPGLVAGAGKNPWRMRLSASSVAFTKLKIEEACERIAKLGFEGIDIWANFRGCTHLDDAAKRLGADGLKELLAKNKLKINAFSIYTVGYERHAELLGKLGGGVAIRGSEGRLPKPEELVPRMKKFMEKVKPLVALAEKHNSYLAIENHGNALLHTHDSFKAFVDLNSSKHLGIALAPYHLQAVKIPIHEAIETCGKQLFFFYAWQRQKGLGQLPGHGPTDFKPALKALAKADYRHYVNPFMHNEPEPEAMMPALKKSRGYLLDCYKQAIKQ